jgi:hypothetical protein
MKKLNDKQVEAISSAWANLEDILFLGVGVGLVATRGTEALPIGILVFMLLGWLLCQVASVMFLSYWRQEDEHS